MSSPTNVGLAVLSDRDKGLLSSVQRALRVLEVISCAEEGVTAKAVARRSGLKLSTTYHLLNTLVSEGYVVRLQDRHGFGIGYKIPLLYQRLRLKIDVDPGVHEVVTWVHDQAHAAAYFANLRDTQIVVTHVVDSPSAPRVESLQVGFHEAAHATAFGKVMLSTLTYDQRTDYLREQGMVRLTPMTITERGELEADLDRARTRGGVCELEEFQLNVACVGVGVHGANDDVVGAMAVSVPAKDYEQRRTHLERILREGTRRASQYFALATHDVIVPL